jgi:hypothetical protein
MMRRPTLEAYALDAIIKDAAKIKHFKADRIAQSPVIFPPTEILLR